MTDTDSESSYIREVTDYFCALAGRVAIISSEDEHLLMKWRRDGISKQDVLMGIRKAFEGGGMKRVKISACSRFVEERLSGPSPTVAPGGHTGRAGVHSVLSAVSVNMTNALAQTRDPKVAECIRAAHGTLSQSATSPDVWDLLKRARRQMCEDLMAAFEPARRERIMSAARETVLSSGRKFINEDERQKVLTACTDDLVMGEVGFEGMFSLSGEEGDG